MEIFAASQQWATRPQDERFRTLAEMFNACKSYAAAAVEKVRQWSDLRVTTEGEDVVLSGNANNPARLTHFAFGQLAARVGAPGAYLRTLPAALAADALNYGLQKRDDGASAALLFHHNGGALLRAVTSEKYSRIWNYEVCERLMGVCDTHNLLPAAPTFRHFDDGKGNYPALYASAHDMFAFVMSRDRYVTDPIGKSPLYRGVIVTNSEVGASALKLLGFNFREICGNHIIWGAQEIAEISLRHVGKVRDKWQDAAIRVRKYLDAAGSLDTARFAQVTRAIPGATKDEVLDAVFAQRPGVSRAVLSAGYDAVQPDVDGAPNTPWGVAQGLTRHSQTVSFADDRTTIDRAAGKVLDFAF